MGVAFGAIFGKKSREVSFGQATRSWTGLGAHRGSAGLCGVKYSFGAKVDESGKGFSRVGVVTEQKMKLQACDNFSKPGSCISQEPLPP